MTLVDTNVLLDILYGDSEWDAWSKASLARAASRGIVLVNPIILAELTPRFEDESDLLTKLKDMGLELIALPVTVAWHAGKALQAHRKRGGTRPSPPPDFFIGAHAMAEGWTILTRDPRRYRTYFPKVKLIAPRSGV